MSETTTRIRNDGKPARRSLHTTPASRQQRIPAAFPGDNPSWHELVQPGPAGDPAKKQAGIAMRAERRGTFRTLVSNPKNDAHTDRRANALTRTELRQRLRGTGRLNKWYVRKSPRSFATGLTLASPTCKRGKVQRALIDKLRHRGRPVDSVTVDEAVA